MKTRLIAAFLFAAIAVAAQSRADDIKVARSIPYAEDAEIAGKIRRECQIQTQLADFIKEFGAKNGHSIQLLDAVDETLEGKVLVVEIRDAVSEGNAFLGHRKSTSARGKLYENGELIGSFKARRNSMGGAFAGYKGSCSVLGRTVKTMGEDIAIWLKAPTTDALLGDLE
jgi:hypothetical protein